MTQSLRHGIAPVKTLIVGLGKTGLACARYLVRRGEPVAITDSRTDPPGLAAIRAELPDVALFLGGFDVAAFEHAERLVVSPGVPVALPQIQSARERGVPVLGDIELFAQAVADASARVAAITGSNGKSTVTTLLGDMARRGGVKAAVGGNLGEPALALLADAVEMYVLELSSFQLETTQSLRPAAACVLNLSADHMDRYPDLDAYAAAKARIFAGADIAVVNADDPLVAAMPGGRERWSFTLGRPESADVFGIREIAGERWLSRAGEPWLRATELRIPGEHNLANALAALALGTALGLERAAMLEALRVFPGLPHRSELVAECSSLTWYNDSKGTNVGACRAALRGLDRGDASRSVLIAGGDCKGADLRELAPVVSRCARAVVVIGRDAPALMAALEGVVPLAKAQDMDEAVRLAAQLALPGDRVLLSPACASLDMFSGYEERGRVFVEAVRRHCR